MLIVTLQEKLKEEIQKAQQKMDKLKVSHSVSFRVAHKNCYEDA